MICTSTSFACSSAKLTPHSPTPDVFDTPAAPTPLPPLLPLLARLAAPPFVGSMLAASLSLPRRPLPTPPVALSLFVSLFAPPLVESLLLIPASSRILLLSTALSPEPAPGPRPAPVPGPLPAPAPGARPAPSSALDCPSAPALAALLPACFPSADGPNNPGP